VVSGSIASGQIGWAHISSGAIRSGSIDYGAVVSGSVASGQIGFYHLASGVISTAVLGSGQVVSGTIASGTVNNFALSSGAVLSGHIGNNAVVSGSIASGQISTFHIASGSITANLIASGAIISVDIADNAVVSGKVASGSISSVNLASGAVLSGHIGNNAVVSGSIASGQIGANHVASGVLFAVTNPSDNRIITSLASGTNLGNAEANLTFDGQTLSVVSTASGSNALSVTGVNGELFTVSDSSQGLILEVGNISGNPIFFVNSSGLVGISTTFGAVNTNRLFVKTTLSGAATVQEWINASGTTVASVNNSGVFTGYLAANIVVSGNIAFRPNRLVQFVFRNCDLWTNWERSCSFWKYSFWTDRR